MPKLNKLIREVLYEEKGKIIKLFYTTDIVLVEKNMEEPAPEKENQEELSMEQAKTPKGIFKSKLSGEATLSSEEAKTILSLEDLLSFLNKKFDKNNKIINDLVVEIILSLTEKEDLEKIADLLSKEDKINIIIDYGFSEEDSIGIQVNKNLGVDLATLLMRKDGKPMGNGTFDVNIFNQTITNIFLKEIE